VRLPAVLASLNNGHSSNLRAYCTGVSSSSKPSFVPTKPLHPRSVAWQFSFIVNLSSTALRCALAAEVETHTVANRCHVAMTTLACSLIWCCNNFVLNHCTSSFSVSPSLASKPVKRKLNLHSPCLGMSTRVSTAHLTTQRTFLAITVVHLGSSINVALVVIIITTLCSISWLTARLPAILKEVMFSMAASILDNCASTNELLVVRPMTSQCLARAA